jgi:hypothetical protein
MPHESSPFATNYVHNRLALAELSTRLEGPEMVGVVDINVSGITETPVLFEGFDHAQEVLEWYAEDLPADDEFDSMRRGASADIMYARLARGEAVEFEEKMLKTVGFVPEAVPEGYVDDMQDEMTSILQELDFGLRYDEASVVDFADWLVIPTQKQNERKIMAGKRVARKIVGRFMPVPTYVMPTFVTNKPWSGGFTMEDGEFAEYYNVDSRQSYTPDAIAALTLHESGHHADFANRSTLVATGILSPSEGITGIHSPETTQAEVLSTFFEGILTQYAVDEKELLLAQFRRVYNRHFDAQQQNALIKIGQGKSEAEVAQDMMANMPFETPKRMKAIVANMQDSILGQINTAHYWHARQNADIMLDDMNDQQRRQAVAVVTGRFIGHAELTTSLEAIARAE